MKNKLLTFAGAIALMAVLGHFYAKPLLAAVAALVKNVDERGRNPYIQQQTCYIVSTTNGQCAAFFPPVPANMRLVIEHVNISIDTPNPFQNLDIYGNGSIIESGFLQKQSLDSQGNPIYVQNQPFLTYYEAGQTPIVAINTGAPYSFISASITFTGYLVNLSQ